MMAALHKIAAWTKTIWTQLTLSHFLIAYGVSQIIILVTSFIRIPLLSKDMTTNEIGYWFLWVNLLAWSPAVCASVVNRARLAAQNPKSDKVFLQIPIKSAMFILALSIISFVLYPPHSSNVPLAGLGCGLLTVATMLFLSPYLGFQQGLGKGYEQFLATSFTSVIALLLTKLICSGSWWESASASEKVFSMVLVSCFSVLGPHLWAIIKFWKKVALVPMQKSQASSRFSSLYETASLLPPAVISGFDSIALVMTNHANALSSYGVMSRMYLIITAIPGAIYTQIFNHMSKVKARPEVTAIRLAFLMVLLNAPLVLGFAIGSQRLGMFLTHGKVLVDLSQVLVAITSSLLLPFWVALSGGIVGNSKWRISFGKLMLLQVIPVSIGSTFIFSYFLGAVGPLIGTVITYCLASALAFRLLKASNDDPNSDDYQPVSSQIRILIVCRSQYGYHTDTYMYSKYLDRSKYDVSYVCFDNQRPRIDTDGVKVSYVSKDQRFGKIGKFFAFIRAAQILVPNHDVIFIKHFPGCAFLRLFTPYGKTILDIRTRSVSTSHWTRLFHNICIGLDIRLFKYVSVISEELLMELHLKQAHVIPLGTEIDKGNAEHQETFSGETLEVIYVGTFTGRRLSTVLRGLGLFTERNPSKNVRITLVGDGIPSELEVLHKVVNQYKLHNQVSFTGYLKGNELDDVYQRAHLGLAHVPNEPRYSAQPSTKVFEYWGRGIPVIGTSYPMNNLYVTPGFGILYEDSSEGFASALSECFETWPFHHADEIRSLGERYSWKRVVSDSLEPLLDEVAESSSAVSNRA